MSISTKILKTDQEKIAFEGAFTNEISKKLTLSRKELEARVDFQKAHPYDNDVLTPEQISQAENEGLI